MGWIDAMRGFSMCVVVLGHVLLSMQIGGYNSFIGSIFLTFRMPLFFFVSGFFSYKASSWWSKKRVGNMLKRKIQAQILCTLLFASLFQLINGGVFPSIMGLILIGLP
ncbi:MAG: acyltransferase family protein [Prevotellaceae bacterium]|nr:acyltransferase family protein [Prevotellaceae bacterium]